MARLPYFPFYPADWLSDPKVKAMSRTLRSVYMDLMCHMWTLNSEDCSLPDDDAMISRILSARLSQWKTWKAELTEGEGAVLTAEGCRIYSRRLQKEAQKAHKKKHNECTISAQKVVRR